MFWMFLIACTGSAPPPSPTPTEVVLAASAPVDDAVADLLSAFEAGATRLPIGVEGGERFWVGPPPQRGTSLHIPVRVDRQGYRISSAGGAEHEEPCGPCATPDDWPAQELPAHFEDVMATGIIVVFTPGVPWGAVVAAVEAAGDRDVRIARGQ